MAEYITDVIEFIIKNDPIDTARPTYGNWVIKYSHSYDTRDFPKKKRGLYYKLDFQDAKRIVDYFTEKGVIKVPFEGGDAKQIEYLFFYYKN